MFSRLFASFAAALMAGVMLAAAGPLHAQSPAPYPKPDLDIRTNGQVHAMQLLPDNRLIIAGNFTQVNGVPRSNIARLQANGALDMDWAPAVEGGTVYALAVDSSGFVYAGGSFIRVGDNSNARRLARLSPTGVVDPNWTPSPNNTVLALALDTGSNPAVFAGGHFTSIGGASRARLARLAWSNGQADPNWNVPANAAVHALLRVSAPGIGAELLAVGGRFTQIGGQQLRYLVHVNPTNGITYSPGFNVDANGAYSESQPGVYALARNTPYGIVAGGVFRHAGGLQRHGLFRYSLISGVPANFLDTQWNPFPNQGGVDADAEIHAIAVDETTGAVYVGGVFSRIGAQDRVSVARILPSSAIGVADPSWDAALDRGPVRALVAASGAGVVFAGGNFTRAGNQPRIGTAALGSVGQPLDRVAQVAGAPGEVYALLRQPDGGVLVGGRFQLVDGTEQRQNLLRVRPDGNLDPTWKPRFSSDVWALEYAPNGSVFVGGAFARVDGVGRRRLAKLTPTGVLDPLWTPSVNGTVYALELSPAGWLYAGGAFSHAGSAGSTTTPRASLARFLDGNYGMLDATWDPGVYLDGDPGVVRAVAVSPDGAHLVIGGSFDQVAGQSRTNIAKLSFSGVVDEHWFFPANDEVWALEFQDNDWIFAGGFFSQIGARPRQAVARISMIGNGFADANWDAAANGVALALELAPDGSLFVAGVLGNVGGQPRGGLARLSGTGPALAVPGWDPLPELTGIPFALTGDGSDGIYVGGVALEFAGREPTTLARLPGTGSDVIFADGFEP